MSVEATARPVLPRASSRERLRERGFRGALLTCLAASMVMLGLLFFDVIRDGAAALSLQLFTNFPSIDPAQAGLQSALFGTLAIMAVCALFIVPVGVGSAVYLEEFADRDRWYNRFVEVNIQNLASVPSIVYGILGLAFLVRGPLSLGRVVLAGGLTLGLLVLPVVVIAGREAIRAVPAGIREGSMALGATRWQTIWKQVLPAAIPGTATGVILALSRAIGETAPLILVATATFVAFNPTGPFSSFTALPLQILAWIRDPQDEFKALAAAAILVLLALLLLMNSAVVWLRNRYEQKW